ncbi:MAG: RNA 3'-terminal phosphate cyclase [Halanaeroarchaeum sp.]
MRSIDGQPGGGQLVRTAVALSAVTGDPIRMENVRGGRDEPGLKPQHVASIETVAALTDATTENVTVGSETFEFEPGAVDAGRYERGVGTAGSITLVFDAVVPLALRVDEPATVAISGGTDVKWSPPFDYFRHVKLPLLSDFGVQARTTLERRGFYPTGGGHGELTIEPSTIERVDLETRGGLESVSVHSVASESLESASVAERQADTATEALEGAPVSPPGSRVSIDTHSEYVETPDKGSTIVIVASFESSAAGFTALGAPGKPAEDVARTATDRFERFLDTDAAVDAHMADQIVPYLALAGGQVRIPRVTDHVETHLGLIEAFGFTVTLDSIGNEEARLVSSGDRE